MEADARIDARIRRLFPFELTAGQEQAIAEIAADLASPPPMNRLLQGDVGSGKTIVAVYAMLLVVAHGYQAVLMAPTEVLARQHVQTLQRLLAQSQVRRAQLTGGLPARQRDATLLAIAAGQVDLVVGTQAILQEDVHFRRLGLVVIDEQHKFGVRQRALLKQAGAGPALPGDDRHAHSPHGHHDALRRPGGLHHPRQSARPSAGPHLPGRRGAARPLVGILRRQAPPGTARLRGHAAGRGLRPAGRGQPGGEPTRPWPTGRWRPSAWA